jgi:hemolysin D
MGPVREIIPKRDLEQVEEALMEHTTKREEASHRISELYAKEAQIRKEIGYIQSNYRTQLLTDLALMQKRSIELQAQIKQIEFKNDKQTLTSPEDGIIDELAMNTVGGVVQPGQKIMSLIPSNAPLVVESAIQNKDIGYVQTGLPVNVKVDTFDFQKYGIIPGKLLLLSSDSHQDKNQPPVYKASIELQKHSLKVNGNETPLKAGMTVTAEVKVGKRKIIEFFIYPLIRSLNESVSVR